MLRIVLDANIIISAAFGGIPLEAVFYASKHTIYVNEEIENELNGVAERLKGKMPATLHKELKRQVRKIIRSAIMAKCGDSIKICRDPKDNMYLELAKVAKIDVLITGDKDLLSISVEELKKVGLHRLKIITPKNFVTELSGML